MIHMFKLKFFMGIDTHMQGIENSVKNNIKKKKNYGH